MRKIVLTIISLVLIQTVNAKTLYEQLCEFNFNWEKHENVAPLGSAINLESDQNYVQTHLTYVIPILRANPTKEFTAEQKKTRQYLINLLETYREAGKFPANYYRTERTPIFIDEDNTHCALGYLLEQTGFEPIAIEIAEEENYDWVKDIQHEAIPNLQVLSGFTVEELKLIQGAYDFYLPNAFYAPNKYEIPQKPEVIEAYFEAGNGRGRHVLSTDETTNIWCKGEGVDGVLHGRWEQRHSAKLPWIIGYFSNGKRTGQWREYYQGTDKLCRTENWRNDKLNGIRKRFDRQGKLVEEILFKDGVAVTKTNYDLNQSLRFVRKPLDSTSVYTEVYTLEGALLAAGNESVHNPGGLLWFQNIELTALNTFAITSRDISTTNGISGNQESFIDPNTGAGLYNAPPLVEYKKEGDWAYYKEYTVNYKNDTTKKPLLEELMKDYKHFWNEFYLVVHEIDELDLKDGYDSVRIAYRDNYAEEFYGYGKDLYSHVEIRYHELRRFPLYANYNQQRDWWSAPSPTQQGWDLGREAETYKVIRRLGQYNANRERIGVWKHFDASHVLYKTETYLLPWADDNKTFVTAR
ncbi:MAG: hypothetical protein GQ574_16530 [Crocinitomix sp.]|nr:hypothetical protein [Crocinitomix sp.]